MVRAGHVEALGASGGDRGQLAIGTYSSGNYVHYSATVNFGPYVPVVALRSTASDNPGGVNLCKAYGCAHNLKNSQALDGFTSVDGILGVLSQQEQDMLVIITSLGAPRRSWTQRWIETRRYTDGSYQDVPQLGESSGTNGLWTRSIEWYHRDYRVYYGSGTLDESNVTDCGYQSSPVYMVYEPLVFRADLDHEWNSNNTTWNLQQDMSYIFSYI